jgi:hypothetical protein
LEPDVLFPVVRESITLVKSHRAAPETTPKAAASGFSTTS